MRDFIRAALKDHGAEYVDIRIENNRSTNLVYRGRELEDISRTTSKGGCVRALVNGGWGFVAFNNLDNLREKVTMAVSQARLVGGETSKFFRGEPVDIRVPANPRKDPSSVSLADKKKLFDEYNDIIWSTPKIQTSAMRYGDGTKQVIFANSEGSYIDQERIDVTFAVNAMARADGDVQQSGISIGSNGDYSIVESLHDRVRDAANRAVEFLSAPTLPGGPYTVVLDPILAGVFIHEAFGHLSEADFISENPRMKETMVLGQRFGDTHLSVVDDGAVAGLRGSYAYDDEGIKSGKTDLIRDGVLVGRLHSRETAARMGELPTGNGRAINYQFSPLVRMTNTYIEPQKATLDELLAGVKDGVYCKNWYGGMTSMEMFTFSAGEAYRVRNGKVEELVRPVVLSGNVFETLRKIDGIGNDLDLNQGGGCGKGGQFPLAVSNGSPHIRIQDCLVGGK